MTGIFTNQGTFVLSGSNDVSLAGSGSEFINAGLFKHEGVGRLALDRSGNGVAFENLPAGVYQFVADILHLPIKNGCPARMSSITKACSGRAAASPPTSGSPSTTGAAASRFDLRIPPALSGGGTSSGGFFTIAGGASLDLTGGGNPTWSGVVSGAGAGLVLLSSGTLSGSGLALDFTNDMFHWTGGSLSGVVTNQGTLVLADRTT